MSTIKKDRSIISINPDSPQLRMYQFYVDMGGRQLPRENLCHYFWAVTFWPIFYLFTRKRIVKDLTILNIIALAIVVGFALWAIMMEPLLVGVVVAVVLFFYKFGRQIVSFIERVVDWYQSNDNYKLMGTKILITLGIIFAISTQLFGFDNSWTVFRVILLAVASCVVIFGTVAGIVITMIFMIEQFQKLQKSRAKKMAESTTSPMTEMAPVPQKQGNSILKVIWMYLKTLKENYLCPFIELPEGAIRPRNYSG